MRTAEHDTTGITNFLVFKKCSFPSNHFLQETTKRKAGFFSHSFFKSKQHSVSLGKYNVVKRAHPPAIPEMTFS